MGAVTRREAEEAGHSHARYEEESIQFQDGK